VYDIAVSQKNQRLLAITKEIIKNYGYSLIFPFVGAKPGSGLTSPTSKKFWFGRSVASE
jgi:hypothetical protein